MQSTFPSGGRNIRIDMHEPPTTTPHPAIILMHGAGGNVGFWLDRLAPHLSAAGIALYAPHYFERTGTARADYAAITDGVHVPQWLDTLDAAVAFAAQRPNVDPARIALIGISLGAFLSLAFAAGLSASSDPQARHRIRALVDLSGGLTDPFAGRATRDFPPTLILHGEADTVVPVSHAHALDALLTKLAVPHETRLLPSEGHWFSVGGQMQLLLAVANFLSKHL
jgi:dienelactone hydrolase